MKNPSTNFNNGQLMAPVSSKLHPPPLDYLEKNPRPGIVSSMNILVGSLKGRDSFKKQNAAYWI